MDTDILTSSLRLAADLLDTTRRAWIIGIANLAGLPDDTPPMDEEKIRTVIEIASSTADFPSGPLSYIGSGYDVTGEDHHRLVTLVGGPDAPNLEMQLGLGIGGFVAAALTRTDIFDDGSEHVGGVPLADVESVIADTFVLAVGTSLAQSYTGPVEFGFGIFDDRPGVPLVGYVIDDETGALTPAPIQEGFGVVKGATMIDETMTPRSAHLDIHRMAADALARFGALPQLTSMLDPSNETYSSNPLLYQDPRFIEVWNG